MKNLLKVGQVFRCTKFRDLDYAIAKNWLPAPHLDQSRMGFGIEHVSRCHWTEHGEDGWHRDRETVLNTRVDDADTIGSTLFVVTDTRMTGGGTAHGPGDVYPDGHHVTARELGGRERWVGFYQTGCFRGLVLPEDVELIREEPNCVGAGTVKL